MRPRKRKHPPQGTSRIMSDDSRHIKKADLSIAAGKLLEEIGDKDLFDLSDALDYKENNKASKLLKKLKVRYGNEWKHIANLVQLFRMRSKIK